MRMFVLGLLIGALAAGIPLMRWFMFQLDETVDRGYALYCPNNGEWAWIGECEGETNE